MDGIALLIATESDDGLSDGEELRLGGLGATAARAVLTAAFGDELASSVLEQVVETAQGNPLALLEIARDLTPSSATHARRSTGRCRLRRSGRICAASKRCRQTRGARC